MRGALVRAASAEMKASGQKCWCRSTRVLRTPRCCETINTIVTDHRPKRKRATLRDVAELTGLSPAGVSYALRGQRVSAATEERVRDAADQLGFRSDPIARALRGGSTGVIGVIGGSLADYWHQEFASELQRHLRRRGRHMLLADADGDAATEVDLARGLLDQRVDGLIALPVAPDSPGWTEILAQVPVVAVGAPLPPPAGAIRFQAEEGAELVLEHLRTLGHERIVVLSTGVHRPRRRRGVQTRTCGFAAADGRAATAAALRRRPPPTAVFALSDALAYGAYMACAALGRHIPQDVSVAGFDDHPISRLLSPALTTVNWDTARAAAAAAAMLLDAIEGRRRLGRELVVRPRLVARDSTASPEYLGPGPNYSGRENMM
jgi:LacI family transcriptional regulator